MLGQLGLFIFIRDSRHVKMIKSKKNALISRKLRKSENEKFPQNFSSDEKNHFINWIWYNFQVIENWEIESQTIGTEFVFWKPFYSPINAYSCLCQQSRERGKKSEKKSRKKHFKSLHFSINLTNRLENPNKSHQLITLDQHNFNACSFYCPVFFSFSFLLALTSGCH